GGFHDVYVDRAAIVVGGPRYGFNGPGGYTARPTAGERLAERHPHVERTSMQASHAHAASLDRGNRFSENHGRPMGGGGARPGGAGRPAEHAGGARPGGAAPPGGGGP